MNINKFKEGDIITRNEPCFYPSGVGDSSYCGDRLILRGHDKEAKIIYFEAPDNILKEYLRDLSYARNRWDEGWCDYPETLFQKIKKQFNLN